MPQILIQSTDDRFQIAPSKIPGAGLGLFAKVPLRPGDSLEVPGVLIQPNSPEDRCTHFADCYKYRVGPYLLIPIGLAALVNHSLSPNLEKTIDQGQIYLKALTPISAGAELYFTYSLYAQKRFGLSPVAESTD